MGTYTYITYYKTKDFEKALTTAFLQGGIPRKKQDKVRIVLGSLDTPDPFQTLSVTKHGETRLRNCVKYELGDGWRLVTRQTDKTCTFLYMGDHEDTEKWLDGHQGQDIGVKHSRLILVPGVDDNAYLSRERIVDCHESALLDLLQADDDANHLLDNVPPSVARKFWALTSASTSAEVDYCVGSVSSPEKAALIKRVLVLLLAGNRDGAQAHIDLNRGTISPIEDFDPMSILKVEDGDEIRRIRVGSLEYEKWLSEFERRSSWQDWFLFLHPEQEKVVNSLYPGTAQLSGVSGSGKTCVVVRRAMRLAELNGSRVLVLTLNRSLAGLLRKLVEAACLNEAVRSRISVTSFFELARDLLVEFEPHNARHFQDVTDTLLEHVDEVFREYYRQWTNNDDASILSSFHRSLNARGVSGENYVRQEFDWIRSTVRPNERVAYLKIERKGRKFPIPPERRRELLQGLYRWERKMEAVGVIDYLGLTTSLTKHFNKIGSRYTNVLVDEAQDFGTTELRVIRQLVSTGNDDLFLAGDIAQTVLPKHRSLTDADITLVSRERIRKNYRNSREILSAAYELLKNNLHEEMFESGDLEILDPSFANFSGPAPVALAAPTLESEIAFARAYAATRLAQNVSTVCVAFAGFSTRDVEVFAGRLGIAALNGAYNPKSDRLVFSDLEQTKGYEFDTMVIVNCCEDVVPARDAPKEEQFRDACKLYVAMTRARRELLLSFNGAASHWIQAVSGTITVDDWHAVEDPEPRLFEGVPEILPEIDPLLHVSDAGVLMGKQYIYTAAAMGLSLEAQDKLIELDGKGAILAGTGRRTRWPDIRSLAEDLVGSHRQDTLFGPKVAEELRANLKRLVE
jgi:hypothetical protein